jgi:ApbE superfamily uncharacterized protein (UPF0280 family)
LLNTFTHAANTANAQQHQPQILRWMEQAGMNAHIDAIGNVHGVIEGR